MVHLFLITTFSIIDYLFYVIFLFMIDVFASYVFDDLLQDWVMNHFLHLCELVIDHVKNGFSDLTKEQGG